MAARGARSRNTVEKQIQKESAKRAVDRNGISQPGPIGGSFGPVSSRAPSGLGWARKGSVLSSSASATSRESGTSSRINHATNKISEKLAADKFVDKGKETTAPRGRRGGVPVKSSESKTDRSNVRSVKGMRPGSATPLGQRPETKAAPHIDSLQNPVHERTWENTKIFSGDGVVPKPYAGFERDDDLWQSDGNCLIFFSEETDDHDPRPMLRIHKEILQEARSVFMINLLRYGEIVSEDDASTTPISASAPWPLTETSLGNLDELLKTGQDSTPAANLRPPQAPDSPSRRSITSHVSWSTSGNTYITPEGNNHPGPRVPPSISEQIPTDADETDDQMASPPSANPSAPAEITHEIWFRAPSHIKRPDIQRRHHMATRNYLALLYGLPLIGNDFYEMLSDLQNVMDTYYELNEPSERWDSAQVMVQYLSKRKLDDVRGNLSAALGLMAWSEQPGVSWDAGYLEGYVHAVGMMVPRSVEMREFKNLSQVSRHKLQNAYNAMQLRLIEAEERLERFEFPELWYAEGVASNHPAQSAFEEFRHFLVGFYNREYGHWPPKETDHQGRWMSRTLVNRLQGDLGVMYDYLVDRDVSWDVSEERHTRKWEMICNSSQRSTQFLSDSPGLPITSMLVGYDSNLRYDHIPHPFPLLPKTNTGFKDKGSKKGLFGKFGRKDPALPGAKEQYQLALAFNSATNVDRLGTNFKGLKVGIFFTPTASLMIPAENKLLDAFQTHERSFAPSILSPSDGRLGRWVLLYGILQVLSTISVETTGLKFSSKIRYFVCPSLDGCPPWKTKAADKSSTYAMGGHTGGAGIMREARQSSSHCWLAAQKWALEQGFSLSAYSADMPMLRNSPSQNSLSELDGRSVHRDRNGLKTPVAKTRSSPLAPATADLKPDIPNRNAIRPSPAPAADAVPKGIEAVGFNSNIGAMRHGMF